MDTLIGLLPFVALLACPLLMGICFWGMRRMDSTADVPLASVEPVTTSAVEQPPPLAEQVAGLQERLARLKVEQDEIAIQLAELAWQEAGQGVTDERQRSSDPSPATEVTAIQT